MSASAASDDGGDAFFPALRLAAELIPDGSLSTPADVQKFAGLVAQRLLGGQYADKSAAQEAGRHVAAARAKIVARQLGSGDDARVRVCQFYSASRDSDDLFLGFESWRKYLSNFAAVPGGGVAYDGRLYPTIEHAFHAAKYLTVDEPALAKRFEVGESIGRQPPVKAKLAGGRKGMEQCRSKPLDVARWESGLSEDVTWKLLTARAAVDEKFCEILEETRLQNVTLLHFERSGARSKWGGSLSKADGTTINGRNLLGQLMMKLRDQLAAGGSSPGSSGSGEPKKRSVEARTGAAAGGDEDTKRARTAQRSPSPPPTRDD
jgi:predicted NAD-dependent protein-ADP-ribosyltransferase YbiA (DUF1768 family)